MLPQNGGQPRQHQQQQQHQSGLPSSFMSQNPSFDPSSQYFNLDPSQAAKQMAALSAASQARIAANSRAPSIPLPPGSGTSSGPYLGGINSSSYPPGNNNDLLASSANGHANFQMQNTHSIPPTPNPALTSFMDSPMSQSNPARSSAQGPTSLKQRQQGFLHGLANVMLKRGTPLPSFLTGVGSTNQDASNPTWSMIEPSSEVGGFRLAGKDVDLFKLWGLVVQHGGGQVLTSNNGWSAILPQFDLPENFPQPQVNGSTSVALMLAQYYMVILYPFEEVYRKNIQDTQKKAQMMSGRPPIQSQPSPSTPSNQGRPGISNGTPGMMPQMPRNVMGNPGGVHVPLGSTNGSSSYAPGMHTPQMLQQRSASAMLTPQGAHNPAMLTDTMSISSHPTGNLPDNNLLEGDIQGIKRKLDVDDAESKRARQKIESLETTSSALGMLDRTASEMAASQFPNAMPLPPRTRMQPSRRKIEYVPLAREVDTYGGRDLKTIENEWINLPQRRPLRDINDWGTIDIEALTMSLRSRLSTELSYALTTFTLLSTMRGQTPGSGFPIFQCVDLLDEMLDLLEEEAFGNTEEPDGYHPIKGAHTIMTNRQLVDIVYAEGIRPFAPLEPTQQHKVAALRQQPAEIVLAVLNIIRNLSVIADNVEFIARHERLTDIILRICTITQDKGGVLCPVSLNLSLADLIAVRKDVLYILTNIAGFINLAPNGSSTPATECMAQRAFDLVASYLVDPIDAVSPFLSVQVVGTPLTGSVKPSSLADMALEVFTRFSQTDANRQVLMKIVPEASLWQLFEALVHRLPIIDADFQILRGEVWLSYLEKIIMSIYSIAFLASPDMKQRVKSDHKLGFKPVMLRMMQKFLITPSRDSRTWFLICMKRAIEALKVLDDGEDSFEKTESAMPIMSFGMGFGDAGEGGFEKGTGLLGGHRDLAWHLLMVQEVQEDQIMFGELESLVRVECG
ncbi:hypothetical protein BDQ12DRAFT_703844 [Crucibulum laeve]|uniref:ARID domain-containing protein n=1 Tax=Crucibulum laeve TaxID=68775 RepID=A0A5C3M8I9_9AGAR|nr:hypothetical protein BDQ12DRAFT_703844 [Crucibulum laeve]